MSNEVIDADVASGPSLPQVELQLRIIWTAFLVSVVGITIVALLLGPLQPTFDDILVFIGLGMPLLLLGPLVVVRAIRHNAFSQTTVAAGIERYRVLTIVLCALGEAGGMVAGIFGLLGGHPEIWLGGSLASLIGLMLAWPAIREAHEQAQLEAR
jgi:hypothetical protein